MPNMHRKGSYTRVLQRRHPVMGARRTVVGIAVRVPVETSLGLEGITGDVASEADGRIVTTTI